MLQSGAHSSALHSQVMLGLGLLQMRQSHQPGSNRGKEFVARNKERRKAEGSRKTMWVCDNIVVESFQITSVFYIVKFESSTQMQKPLFFPLESYFSLTQVQKSC